MSEIQTFPQIIELSWYDLVTMASALHYSKDEDRREYHLAPQWISVEERLPRTYDNVLFHDDQGIGFGYMRNNGKWAELHTNDEPSGLTHWMPLPSPPDE